MQVVTGPSPGYRLVRLKCTVCRHGWGELLWHKQMEIDCPHCNGRARVVKKGKL